MLTQEQAVEIKVMARRGVSIREMAKQLGCSRNTIRRYLREAGAQQYKPREARTTKLDPYKDYLHGRIEAARPHWIPAAVLLREIQELGYPGGVTQLKEFLGGYKHQEPEPVVRFETPPGKQMQADFTHIRRGRDPLMAFVATLGYSRSSWVRFTTDERADTWFGCLRQAFIYFGGVPQHVLFDNAGAIITERDAYGPGQHRWHNGLLAVAQEFGFTPRVCQPYRAKTKGKVERFNGYLKGSFCVPLAATLKQAGLRFDVTAANAHVGRWLTEVADQRLHGTTRERPAKRLQEERLALLQLPAQHGMLVPATSHRPVPRESFQHPLSVYNELLEVRA
ncbi:IS21 family transposase [Bordetella holmesii]|uniref:Tc3 transposase n=4 Tax=Bordetella holmesii TaxID=35814 RepID=A0A158M4Z0_9BORD|nr:IS21 family transposase [Bordetella holmesii]AHV93296.1 integrase core domain protein [Bordetella holmesii ATCC 51541]AIT27767.1 integrase core domain protein [Bordetella holmesii 44057]EWM40541.1 integrase core domain protein [Bordetella holmesii 35009]EWM43765.1 integrase core domain protein [Bordetella holmesii 41130]EWM44583.1 integrase core domain protein [Bordetella holmesii 70147]